MTSLRDQPVLDLSYRSSEWERIVASLTRRQLIERGAGLGAAALLARSGTALAALEETGVRTIQTAKGPVRIPTHPTRIVCVANYPMENLFDFGVKPVGVPGSLDGESLPRFAAEYKALPKVGSFDQISVEKVAALHPDLILGLDFPFNTPLYKNLSAIAPTVLFALPGTSAWATVAARFADAVGHTPTLERLRRAYRTSAASIRSDYSRTLAETRWAIVTTPKGEWVLWYPDSSGGQVLRSAGARFSKAAAGKTGNYRELSFEQLDAIADADAIAVYANTLHDPRLAQLTSEATWKQLPAVKAGNVFAFNQLFPYSYGDASVLLHQFEAALKKLR